MQPRQLLPSIYEFLDYREYLSDLTKTLKKEKRFNLRNFAKNAEIRSPGYLKMVIDGRRNLSFDTIEKFCKALSLEGKEKKYFEKLVLYNQTQSPDQKKDYFDSLITLRPATSERTLEKQHSRYYSNPHYVTIREMVALKDFQEDSKWIAARCFPPIRPSEAKNAIDMLLELKLLARDKNGSLIQTETSLQTEDRNTQEAEAYHYHEAILDQARQALGRLSQNERHYYALTIPLKKKQYDEIVNDFYAFRDKALRKVESISEDYEDVYQMNFQIYPVTRL